MKKLLNLKVETESGAHLGRVSDCIWNTVDFSLVQIKIRKGLFEPFHFLIHVNQIKEVFEDKIIVFDSVEAEKSKSTAKPAPESLAETA